MFKITLLVAAAMMTVCQADIAPHHGGYHHPAPVHHGHGYGHHDDHHHGPAHYQFGYGVADDYHGTNFGHKETREGYATAGEYHVQLPDGRLQIVTYTADEHGYHPVVTYQGVAHAPVHVPHHAVPHHGGYHH